MVKRGVDVAVAAVLLLLALPVLLAAALWIRVTSPGPVLFRQTRMGKGVRPFQILKLRTMAHAEAGLAYTLGHDPRITPFGKWLRLSKIDELPQLWNVLRGEMSLVGPRPVIPELVLEFNVAYSELLGVRPGLTDPASLKYRQETQLLEKADRSYDFFKQVVTPDKIRISLAYLKRATVWTDLELLLMTGLICCFPALSQRYGQLPDPAAYNELQRRQPTSKVARMPRPKATTESLFPPQSAYAASMVEGMPPLSPLPWILLPKAGLASQSTPSGTGERGSRL